nr:reverse transcriptase domain-containing protein [Tanacetum cinerariifolium]
NQKNQNQNFQNQTRNHGIPQRNNQGRNKFFQGASHDLNRPPAYQAPAYQVSSYQAPVHQPSIPQPQVVATIELTNYMKANDAILKNMQTNMTSLTKSNLELKNMFGQLIKMNTASSSGSRTLPSNTITNLKEDLKGIITRSGTIYQRPMIPTTSSYLPKVVECETEVTKNMMPPTNNGSIKDVQPPVVQIETSILNSEPVVAPIVEPVAALDPAPQRQGVLMEDFSAYVKANDAVMRNMQTQGQNMQNQLTNLTDLLTKFANSNNAFTSSSGTLPSNTIANPRSDLKEITTRSVVSYDGPQIPPLPSFLLKVVENELKATKDIVHPTNNGSTEDVQPLVFQSKSPILTSEPVNSPTIEPVNSPFGPSIKSLLTNKDKLCEVARTLLNEHCSAVLLKKLPEKLGDPDKFLIPCDFPRKAECLALADLDANINLMPLSVWNKLYLPDLSPTCMNLELANRLISRPIGVAEDVYVKVGELTLRVGKVAITFNLDQSSRYSANYNEMTSKQIDVIDMACEEYSQEVLGNYLPKVRKELKIYEGKSDKSSIDEPLEVELKDLPTHLEYIFLEGDDKLPVIIAKDLSLEEKTALITVLKSHNRAIGWKLSDIKGIDPEFFTHKILMEEDFEPAVQHQRRVNPKIYDVIKQEGGFTVVKNEDNELIPTHLVTGWRVCIDYRKLNEASRKDHFPLSFIDQMLERLAGNQYYCFLDGFSGYFQISIDLKDQEKTTFTCPYGTFAYRHMPFGLCNALGTFQRKLTKAPILIAPDWDIPFKLMCDASDFAIGAVLGQCQDKHFRPIHYASKTTTEAESNYTTTEKEMIAVVEKTKRFHDSKIKDRAVIESSSFTPV